MVHHRHAVEAGVLGGAGEAPQVVGELRALAGELEAAEVEREAKGHGSLPLGSGAGGRGEEAGRDERDGLVAGEVVHGVEALGGEAVVGGRRASAAAR